MKTISIHKIDCDCKGCKLGYSFPVNLIPQNLLVLLKSHEITPLNYTDHRSIYLLSDTASNGYLSMVTGKTLKKIKD